MSNELLSAGDYSIEDPFTISSRQVMEARRLVTMHQVASGVQREMTHCCDLALPAWYTSTTKTRVMRDEPNWRVPL